jgi:hypothetical protein
MSGSAEAILNRTAPPDRAPVGLLALWFGVIAAPLVWFTQLLLNYLVTALACYPAVAPNRLPLYSWSSNLTHVFDALAIVVALAGCWVAYANRQNVRGQVRPHHALDVFRERARFMAEWGIIFSVGFLIAIIFETIGSVTVPPCGTP